MKLFVFDIDGTLVVKEKRYVPDSAIRALKELKEKGNLLAIATGRGYSAIDFSIIPLDLFDYVISSNGAVISDQKQNHHIVGKMSDDIIKQLYDDAIYFDGAFEICYFNGVKILYGFEKIKKMAAFFMGEDKFKEYYQKTPSGPSLNAKVYIKDNMEYYQNKYPTLSFSSAGHADIYDVILRNCTKGLAVQHLCRDINLTSDDVVAFGDDDNDIDMIEFAKYGVALKRSSPTLLSKANLITSDIEDNGIYNALVSLGFI